MQNLKNNSSVVSKMTRIWWILTRALKSLKMCTSIGSYCAKHLMFDLEKYRSVIFHDTEEKCKIWRKTDLWFGKWLGGIWQIFTRALGSLKNFSFNGLLLSKVYIVGAKKVQRSYLSWHWRVMQNLKRNWLVFSKLTWGIWLNLMWAVESLKRLSSFRWKSTEELSFMTQKSDTKFGEELTCRFKIDKRNLKNFDLSIWKSQKFSFWCAPFEQSIYCLS